MPELRELKKKPDQAPSPQKNNKLMIGLLSLLLLALIFVFLRERQEVPGDLVNSGMSTPTRGGSDEGTEDPASLDKAEEEADSGDALDAGKETASGEGPSGGQIRIGEEPEAPAPESSGQEEKIIPIPKEELAFFEPLAEQRQEPVPPPPSPSPPRNQLTHRASSAPKILYTIQLGAFKNKKGADALAIRLRKGGYEAYLLAEKGQLYKVRVGEFQSRAAARAVADRIRKTEHLDGFVTRDD